VNAAVVVDVGNTRVKWGRCGAGSVEEVASLPPEPDAWARQLEHWQIPAGAAWVLSGVHPPRRDVLAAWLRQQGAAVTVLEQPRQLPLTVRLEHPERAGIDRLLDAVAVNGRRRRGVPAVVVDAGSAVTVDWLDDTGAFCGGAILPGLRLMAQALHDHTALLPNIELHAVPPPRPGTSTTAALEVGVFWSVAAAIRTLTVEFARGRPDLPAPEVYLTGGDGPLLHAAVGATAVLWPEMTLEGVRVSAAALP
jgi:type III pantothenate kinase